ncbi:uncharacterized protein [Procambarus clarkii]|uniref:uncharacterized protein n=1 Tax=Procambarus clarkii TaxID=6728 RepID=UPI001E672DC4|nr:uncharacterized protein LOC123774101 [Procambarus clarkii]
MTIFALLLTVAMLFVTMGTTKAHINICHASPQSARVARSPNSSVDDLDQKATKTTEIDQSNSTHPLDNVHGHSPQQATVVSDTITTVSVTVGKSNDSLHATSTETMNSPTPESVGLTQHDTCSKSL